MGTWQTDSGYDPERYYLASTDDKGHSDWLNSLRVPQGLAGAIEQMVAEVRREDGTKPYRSKADWVRNAIVHQLARDNETVKSRGVSEAITFEGVLTEVERREHERVTVDRIIHSIAATAESYMQGHHPDPDALADFLNEMEDRADSIPNGHRGRFQAAVDHERRRLPLRGPRLAPGLTSRLGDG